MYDKMRMEFNMLRTLTRVEMWTLYVGWSGLRDAVIIYTVNYREKQAQKNGDVD